MQHRVDAILAEDVLEVAAVANLADDQSRTVDDGRSMPRRQVVVYGDVMPRFDERFDARRSDIPRTANDQDPQPVSPS